MALFTIIINTTVRFNLTRRSGISAIMTALIKNDILPTTLKDIYFQSGMANFDEKRILDLFVPTHSGVNTAPCCGSSKRWSVNRNG